MPAEEFSSRGKKRNVRPGPRINISLSRIPRIIQVHHAFFWMIFVYHFTPTRKATYVGISIASIIYFIHIMLSIRYRMAYEV